MKKYDFLSELAVKEGAFKAQVIPNEMIVLSDTFRAICEKNQCGSFSRCWVCPPVVGTIDELMEKVRRYPYGLLYQTVGTLEDSFDIEGMQSAKHDHVLLSQRVAQAVLPHLSGEYWHLGVGGCGLCERCAKRDDLPCRFPDKAPVAMDACGIDVYSTCRQTDLKYINGQNTVTYFSILLFTDAE